MSSSSVPFIHSFKLYLYFCSFVFIVALIDKYDIILFFVSILQHFLSRDTRVKYMFFMIRIHTLSSFSSPDCVGLFTERPIKINHFNLGEYLRLQK